MQMLYDSESFAVVHLEAIAAPDDAARPGQPPLVRHGFEIVDKRARREIYLDGGLAELFQLQIQAWQAQTPTQEEVEDTLAGYTALAQAPLLLH